MDKLKMRTVDLTDENIAKIAEIFPNCVTEVEDITTKGTKLKKSIDFDLLRQELSDAIVEGPKERYRLDWPGKREALLKANTPIRKTLRPCREESVDFDSTENLFIEGDNLEALKLLQDTYLGKVKMIYIDPPYNTGKDFIYSDKFAKSAAEELLESGQINEEGGKLVSNPDSNGRFHSDWLSMMYPRLKLARNLLRDDGVIFVSIDDNEVHNLRKICDEVFGTENFVAELVLITGANQSGEGVKIQTNTEYCLVFSKSNQVTINRIDKVDESLRSLSDAPTPLETRPDMGYSIYYNPQTKEFIPVKDYDKTKIHSNDVGSVYSDNEGLIRKGFIPIRPGKRNNKLHRWRWSFETFWDRKEEIVITSKKNGYNVSFHQSGFNAPKNVLKYGSGTVEVKNLFNSVKLFDFPKSVAYLHRLLSIGSSNSDIILDFFAGSAATAHAVMKLNAEDGGKRKFIMVQLPEACNEKSEAYKAGYKTISEIAKERIRRAGKKVVSDKWAVISKEEKVKYGCKELSRADCMAKGNGISQGDLFAGQEIAEGGDIQSVGPDAQGGGVNSVEYRGGAGSKLDQGVHTVSGDSKGLESGTGNAASSVREGGIPCRYGYFGSDSAITGDREDGVCSFKNTVHCPLTAKHCPDIGFRVLKVDSTNMADVYYSPDAVGQDMLLGLTDNIKPDRTPEDLLFQVLLDWGVDLTLPIRKEIITTKDTKSTKKFEVFFVDDNALVACFANDGSITEEFCKKLTEYQPLRVVFRDAGFADDSVKINAEQIFKLMSPHTDVKTI